MAFPAHRNNTKQIRIGNVKIGGSAPISIQSMTNTPTADIAATVAQIRRLENAGCEIIRVAVPDEADAAAIGSIKKQISIPLIADIHFDYRLAIAAARAGADALRINPGNIGSHKKVKAVVDCAKDYGLAIRVGVNAGSLEKDILEKYQSVTAEAMVESALRNIDLLKSLDFDELKISLKASDVQRTVESYRLLAAQSDLPLHVGVTEAGTLFSGIVKSALGIGMLLAEGIGDTIRVSLTRDPVEEVRVGYEILGALGIRRRGPEIISCPTCGRCNIGLFDIVEQVENALLTTTAPIKIAIMGCVVNGPGEAREADIGIAGGDGTGILFRKGRVVKKFPQEKLVEILLEEVRRFEANDPMRKMNAFALRKTKSFERKKMEKKVKTAITPTRADDYPEWYQQVIKASDLAERSPVRGCMVIRPWGYALWENIVRALDDMFKATGVKNAYFPLFIPISFLEKEAEHVEGFAKECAVVTHHRLEKDPTGGLVPAGALTEPLVVRPTSETIIADSFSRWVDSHRDLPILINQWANVVRWEMRTRIFLRTSEFLWQEGHTAHATAQEAQERTRMMLDVYTRLAEDYLAMPVIRGRKSTAERFPGAEDTLTIEAMMQDRKALQSGTSHFLGQNFARASEIKFQTADESEEYVWTTSWGSSTRMIGGVIMSHGDDDGIILPPRVASAHVVLMPIIRKPDDKQKVMEYVTSLAAQLQEQYYHHRRLVVEIDSRDIGGSRGWDWIKKGIPLRVEVGPRDIASNSVFVGRRDKAHSEKVSIERDQFMAQITDLLDDIQKNLYERALSFRQEHTVTIDDSEAFYDYFTPQSAEKPEIHGGFALSSWCGNQTCETKIKDDLAVTIRCIPLESLGDKGPCICCGKPGQHRVVFAKAY